MANSIIAPLTLPSGVGQFGPVVAQAGWTVVDLTLDIANLIAPLDLILERSSDNGETWTPMASVTAVGPGIDIHGLPVTSPTFHVSLDDAQADAQVRATVNNRGLPLLTAGGSLTVT